MRYNSSPKKDSSEDKEIMELIGMYFDGSTRGDRLQNLPQHRLSVQSGQVGEFSAE
jgi:hypothetical protein